MASVKLFIRTKSKSKLANIYIRLKEGRTVDLTAKSGKFILPDNWNNKSGSIRQIANINDKDEFINDLKKLKRFIEDEFLKVKDKSNPGKEWLKITVDRYWNPKKYEEDKITFFGFIETYILISKERINPATGKKISESTLKKYGTCYFHLKRFAKRKKRLIDFDDITITFYYDFIKYLTKDCNLATNSIGKQIAILKGFMSEATEQGLNTKTDFRSRSFKVVTENSEAIYLNERELDKLWTFDFSSNKRLEKIRDLFLIGCWTGCRFSDLVSVNSQNIKDGFLYMEQEKTGHKVTIPLHPVVKEILEKYDGTLPVMMSNQKFNDYIKEVCQLAEINSVESKSITKGGIRITDRFEKWKMVSSHTARRSFATNLYKSGFPSISIMAITGHRTERAFLRYIKVTPEEHAILLQKHWIKNTN